MIKIEESKSPGINAEDLEPIKADMEEKIGLLQSEIAKLREDAKSAVPAEAQPAEAQPAAETTAAAVPPEETKQKLEELQAKTKAGFAKVKDDIRKQGEALGARLSEVKPGISAEELARLEAELAEEFEKM